MGVLTKTVLQQRLEQFFPVDGCQVLCQFFVNVSLRWYQRAIGCISTMKFYSLKVKINMRIQPRTYAIYLVVIPAQTTHELCCSLSLHLDLPYSQVCLVWGCKYCIRIIFFPPMEILLGMVYHSIWRFCGLHHQRKKTHIYLVKIQFFTELIVKLRSVLIDPFLVCVAAVPFFWQDFARHYC